MLFLNLHVLKNKYPQISSITIDEEAVQAFLQSISITRSCAIPTTDNILSEDYQREMNALCSALKAFEFNAVKCQTLNNRFIGTKQSLNQYFAGAFRKTTSIPLKLAGQIRQKMEEIAFLLSATQPSLRASALAMVAQDDYACADGTLQNLESVHRTLLGASGSLDYFVGEAKRELIEAKLQEEYQQGTFTLFGGNSAANEIHIIASLINSIADEFGLVKKNKADYPYIIDFVPYQLRGVVKEFASAQFKGDENILRLLTLIVEKIQVHLPPEPLTETFDDKFSFTEQLKNYLERLGFGQIFDLADCESYCVGQDDAEPMDIAIRYKPYLHDMLIDMVALELIEGYLPFLKKFSQEIMNHYLENDFNALNNVLNEQGIYSQQLFGELIQINAQLKATKQNPIPGIEKLLDPSFKKGSQLLSIVLGRYDSNPDLSVSTLKETIKVSRQGVGISKIINSEVWATVIERNLKLDLATFGSTDALEYAIKNKLEIEGQHFLIYMTLAQRKINHQEPVEYLAGNTDSAARQLLNGVIPSNISFSHVNQKVSDFLQEIGVAEFRINPFDKIYAMVNSPEENTFSVQRLFDLLSNPMGDKSRAIGLYLIIKYNLMESEQGAQHLDQCLNNKQIINIALLICYRKKDDNLFAKILNLNRVAPEILFSELYSGYINSPHFFHQSLSQDPTFLSIILNLPNAIYTKFHPQIIFYYIYDCVSKNKIEHLKVILDKIKITIKIHDLAMRKLLTQPEYFDILTLYISYLTDMERSQYVKADSLRTILEHVTSPKLISLLFSGVTLQQWHEWLADPQAGKPAIQWLFSRINRGQNPALTRLLKDTSESPTVAFIRWIDESEFVLATAVKDHNPNFLRLLFMLKRSQSAADKKAIRGYALNIFRASDLDPDNGNFLCQPDPMVELIFGADDNYLNKLGLGYSMMSEKEFVGLVEVARHNPVSAFVNLSRVFMRLNKDNHANIVCKALLEILPNSLLLQHPMSLIGELMKAFMSRDQSHTTIRVLQMVLFPLVTPDSTGKFIAHTPASYAHFINFPEAIPVMFLALYDVSRETTFPIVVEQYLHDPHLSPKDHQNILQELHDKNSALLPLLKSIYEDLGGDLKAVWANFTSASAHTHTVARNNIIRLSIGQNNDGPGAADLPDAKKQKRKK